VSAANGRIDKPGALVQAGEAIFNAAGDAEKGCPMDEPAQQPEIPGQSEALLEAQRLAVQAEARREAGDLAGAREFCAQALALTEQALGEGHPGLTPALNNLAGVLGGLGELREARALYERALDIDEKALASDHPDLAVDLNNLASALREMGDLGEARERFERALAVAERAWGPAHPKVALILSNLAAVCAELGDLPRSLELLARAEAIRAGANQISR
jgi:tetratricopeptide (TPR) repeat protein